MSSTLGPNDSLTTGQSLTSSKGGYIATLQGDGNVVVYQVGNSKALWASGTTNKGGVRLTMQTDGNLVLYTSNNQAVWATNTSGKGLSFAVMQDDGNFVLYLQGAFTWGSKNQ